LSRATVSFIMATDVVKPEEFTLEVREEGRDEQGKQEDSLVPTTSAPSSTSPGSKSPSLTPSSTGPSSNPPNKIVKSPNGSKTQSKRPPRKSTLTQQQKNQKRQRATQDQLTTLEMEFNKNPTPTAQVRERIAEEINMTQRSVQIWFQNRCVSQFYGFYFFGPSSLTDTLQSCQDQTARQEEP
jgi:hypothetical protein